jgi:hypothetical protein
MDESSFDAFHDHLNPRMASEVESFSGIELSSCCEQDRLQPIQLRAMDYVVVWSQPVGIILVKR